MTNGLRTILAQAKGGENFWKPGGSFFLSQLPGHAAEKGISNGKQCVRLNLPDSEDSNRDGADSPSL